MSQSIQIKDVMTSFPHSIGKEQSIIKAGEMMRQFACHHLPVQDGGRLLGIISDRDVKSALGWNPSKKNSLTVKDVFTPEPYTAEPSTPLNQVLRRMVDEQIGCMLIADKGKLLGVFTSTDACRYLEQLLAPSSDLRNHAHHEPAH